MSFWSGFAQGWEAESERIERRKLFQQEQTERRVATLGELIPKFTRGAALGTAATTSGGDDATPASSDHLGKLLIKSGATPETVASLNAEGGAYALNAAWEAAQEVQKAGQPLTPELFTRIQDSIVVTATQGEQYDAKTIIEMVYGPEALSEFEPDDLNLLDMQIAAQGSSAPQVSSTFNVQEPIKAETINQTVTAANGTLMNALVARQREFERMAQDPANAGQEAEFIGRAQDMEALQAQVEAGNVLPAIEVVGADIIGPYLENNPQLKANPELLGSWSTAAQIYLQGGQEAQEPAEIPVGTVDTGPDGAEWEFMGGDPADPANWKKL